MGAFYCMNVPGITCGRLILNVPAPEIMHRMAEAKSRRPQQKLTGNCLSTDGFISELIVPCSSSDAWVTFDWY